MIGDGDWIGPYRIERTLGRGGMGAVFEALHVERGQRFAVKVLLGDCANATALARFEREGQAHSSADAHANILRVRSAGVHEGTPYLVMDLAPGGSLDDRLRQGPLPWAEAAEIARGLANALAHAHGGGILHRDMKPGNVLFDAEGVPKLVDFGLAKITGAEKLTVTGTIVGTPAYMAPEQAEGNADIGAAADAYGLGAVLYHMLTGAAPFSGSSTMNIVIKVMRESPRPVRSLRPDVPPALAELCERCLAKDPEARPTPAEVSVALGALLAGDAPAESSRGLVVAAAAAVGALLLVGALALAPVVVAARGAAAAGPPRVRLALELPAGGRTSGADLAVAVVWSGAAPARLALLADGATVFEGDPSGLPPRVSLALGANRLSAVARTEAGEEVGRVERDVWRFAVPAGFEAGEDPAEIRNPVDGSVLVYHPPGEFHMGWTEADAVLIRALEPPERHAEQLLKRRVRESPRRRVTLTRGFFLGKYEVTRGQYAAFCEVTLGLSLPPQPGAEADDALPVSQVTWREARTYCAWAKVHLPSEAQWEYAARGGEQRMYAWGDRVPQPGDRLANLVGDGDGFGGPSPVGSFPAGASRWGCLDLTGNVFEWVRDLKILPRPEDDVDTIEVHGYLEHETVDPIAHADLADELAARGDRQQGDRLRALNRGGAFNYSRQRSRNGYRTSDDVGDGRPHLGFRVCLTEPAPKNE